MKSIVIVGRPNVGKSSLFNRLTKTRDAIVADMPGLTRDRHYGKLEIQDNHFLLVDTGGFEPKNKEGIIEFFYDFFQETEKKPKSLTIPDETDPL